MYRGCVLNTVAQGFNPSWALYSISNTNSLLLSTFCHYFLSYNNKTMKGHITHKSWCLFSFIHAYWHTHSCPAQWTIYEHKAHVYRTARSVIQILTILARQFLHFEQRAFKHLRCILDRKDINSWKELYRYVLFADHIVYFFLLIFPATQFTSLLIAITQNSELRFILQHGDWSSSETQKTSLFYNISLI